MNKKHTLIVGGTRGIGQALAKTLVKEDHILSVIGRRLPEQSKRSVKNVHYWILDLLDQKSVSKALTEIINKNGRLNNLIFLQRYRGTRDEWFGEINVSMTATKDIIEKLANKFDDTNGKSIVIVSSLVTRFIVKEQPLSYHVAKACLNQMVLYYAVALGQKGIRVNCVSPSTVLKEESKKFYLKNKKLYDLYKKITPLGRMCTSEDIVNTIAFLCSPKASFITGQNIIVDGGLSLQSHESLARELASLSHIRITRKTNIE